MLHKVLSIYLSIIQISAWVEHKVGWKHRGKTEQFFPPKNQKR